MSENTTPDHDWRFRTFTITGRVYSPNESVARHTVFWTIRNSENEAKFLIDDIAIYNWSMRMEK